MKRKKIEKLPKVNKQYRESASGFQQDLLLMWDKINELTSAVNKLNEEEKKGKK